MDDKEVQIEKVSIDTATTVESEPAGAQGETPVENDELLRLREQIDAMNDKYLRAVAELENTRRRAAIDAESRARSRAMSVAEKILPVMDAIQAALQHTPDDGGIKAMAMAMDAAFAQIGIVKIDAVGQVLNPQFHNAIQVVDAPADCDKKMAPNTIVSELQTGYMFGDTVLRTAMVVVCK